MKMKIVLTTVALTVAGTVAYADDLPEVSSGTLVAHFLADPATMTLDVDNAVTAWRANNDSSIELTASGSGAATNILYDATDLHGQGGIRVNDFSGDTLALVGTIGDVDLVESTIFWLGYYAPGRDGSTGDGSGCYAYNYHNGSSYISHQSDDGFVEHYSPTTRGDAIGSLQGAYHVWRSVTHSTNPGTTMHVNGVDLNLAEHSGIASSSSSDSFQMFRYSSSGYNFVGNMHECIIYNGILSATDIAAVETYLEAKRQGDSGGGDVVECDTPGSPGSPCPPDVSSGTLVANFVTEGSTLDLDESNNVLSWRAANDPDIELAGLSTPLSNINFDQDELGGLGALVANATASQRYLQGSIGDGLSDATIFWVGYFDPGRDGSLGDSSGQYVYDLGSDGANGSQMDAQIDDGLFEIYGGASTQTGDSIVAYDGVYSTWMTKFHASPTKIGHEAYVDGVNLNVPTTTDGYQTDGSLVLFAYQNSGGAGAGYNFVGNMHQMLIYDGVLDEADTQAVMDYLNCKTSDCPLDLDGDCVVGGSDLTLFLGAWGSDDADADVDGNGVVDGVDLAYLLGAWGSCLQ